MSTFSDKFKSFRHSKRSTKATKPSDDVIYNRVRTNTNTSINRNGSPSLTSAVRHGKKELKLQRDSEENETYNHPCGSLLGDDYNEEHKNENELSYSFSDSINKNEEFDNDSGHSSNSILTSSQSQSHSIKLKQKSNNENNDNNETKSDDNSSSNINTHKLFEKWKENREKKESLKYDKYSRRLRKRGKIPLPMRSDSLITIESSTNNLLNSSFDQIDTSLKNKSSQLLTMPNGNNNNNNNNNSKNNDNYCYDYSNNNNNDNEKLYNSNFEYQFNFDFSSHLPFHEIDDFLPLTSNTPLTTIREQNENRNKTHNYTSYKNQIKKNDRNDSSTLMFVISIFFELFQLLFQFIGKLFSNLIPNIYSLFKNTIAFLKIFFENAIIFFRDFLGLSNWRDRQSWSQRATKLYEKVATQDQYFMIAENYTKHVKQRKLISRRWNADKIEDKVGKCIICLNDNKDTAFQECGHVVTCYQCSKNLRQCPMCRIKISSKPLKLKF